MEKHLSGVDFSKYEKNYSESNFWDKVKSVALKAGSKVIYAALKLYYSSLSEKTPAWAKSVVYGALGYLILPADLVPDIIPAVGFTDDFAVIAAALMTIELYVTDEVKEKARLKLADWFGGDVEVG